MSAFNAINLSRLTPPEVIESLSVEQILKELIAYHEELDPAFTAPLASDPVYKIFEANAYRELLLRQRINEAAQAVLVAYATGTDLDHLAASIPLERKLLDAGDPDAYPPRPPAYESDDEFRKRIVMAPEGFSTAGPEGAYIFHALSVVGVKDAYPDSPEKSMEVHLYILSKEGRGVPSQALLDEVEACFTKDVRPLTDCLIVKEAKVENYKIEATMHLLSGPSSAHVVAQAAKNLEEYVVQSHALGTSVARSGIDAALHIPGVERIEILEPAEDITPEAHTAAYCTGFTLRSPQGAGGEELLRKSFVEQEET